MATYERSGVTLDQCRECRGIFLDRGELERMVDAEGGAWIGPQPGVPTGATHAAPAPVPPGGYPAMMAKHRALLEPRRDDRDRGGYSSEWSLDVEPFDRRDPRGSYGPHTRPSKKRSFLGELLEGFGD
jgi:hypothetical protein